MEEKKMPKIGSRIQLFALTGALALLICLGLTACGSSSSSSSTGGSTPSEEAGGSGENTGGSDEGGEGGEETVSNSTLKPGDITPVCPKEPTKVTFIKANGGEVWTATSMVEFLEEAKKCPNIEASTANVTGGQQAAVQAYSAAVAQGNKVIVTVPDFGAALLPALKTAYDSGATVVPFLADPEGEAGVDYTEKMLWDGPLMMENVAKWVNENVKEGRMAFLGGPPGVASSTHLFENLKEMLGKYAPGIELVPSDSFTPTGFTAEGMKQAMAGLLAKYGSIQAVFTDYGAAYVGAIQAIEDAGAEQPALASIGDSNGISCEAEKHHILWLAQDGSTRMVRSALRIALADYAELESPEPNPFPLEPYVDTAKEPGEYKCDPSISPDADLSSLLPKDKIKELIAEQG
jgi:ribose transport system substrate-binding protein